jgi:hypothetical protein
MSNEDAQTIFFVIVLLVVLAITFVPFALFIGYVLFQKQKRDWIRTNILRERQQLIGNHKWLPVRYASESRFKAFFKIFPWEGAGILVIAPGSALFLGQMLSRSPMTLQFAPANSTLNWLGKAPWPNGAVSWFCFSVANEKHYFSSETGALVFGSHKSTKAIYDEANNTIWQILHPKIETSRIIRQS